MEDGDCDDLDPGRSPGADEIPYDGIDQDCDGEDLTDVDNDGYVSTEMEGGEDCDDLNPEVHPGSYEVPYDGIDQDCEGGDVTDVDMDGFDSLHVDGGSDCDDTYASVYPGAEEIPYDGVDQNCDGRDMEDLDGDGFASSLVPSGTDCNDSDATIYPGADEVPYDDEDQDCDGEDWVDVDDDGFVGSAVGGPDCEDFDEYIHPDAPELCDDLDNDCDQQIDEEAIDFETYYEDRDNDSYGDPARPVQACEQNVGLEDNASDCNDANSSTYPGHVELCDGEDNDCDGLVDEEVESLFFADDDEDGFGDPLISDYACEPSVGWVANDLDCDDSALDVYPGADEVCNEIDDDCNDVIDDNPLDGDEWHPDQDGDHFGGDTFVLACEAPDSGWLLDGTDCDDSDPRTFPGAQEICDEKDNDCDGTPDDACPQAVLIPENELSFVLEPPSQGACMKIGEMNSMPDPHNYNNLPTFMTALDGTTSGRVAFSELDSPKADWSIRCGSNYSASPGNYTSSTQAWPVLSATGAYGGSRFRAYINIRPQDPLNVTIGLIGNDSLTLIIGGTTVMSQNWSDGRWKKFRYVSFPRPGLYKVEAQWSSNLQCDIDPFEIVWAGTFMPGYENYDTMCASSSCTYGNGVPIPGFTIIGSQNLVRATDGSVPVCRQCTSSLDCSTEAPVCNSAGICQQQ